MGEDLQPLMGSEFLAGLKRAGLIPQTATRVVITAEIGKEVLMSVRFHATNELIQPDLWSGLVTVGSDPAPSRAAGCPEVRDFKNPGIPEGEAGFVDRETGEILGRVVNMATAIDEKIRPAGGDDDRVLEQLAQSLGPAVGRRHRGRQGKWGEGA